jgi:hypothetical protein
MIAAMDYLKLGWAIIPIPAGSKAATVKWKKLIVGAYNADGYFGGPGNIAVKLGEPSKGLIDFDFDWPEAGQVADVLMNFPAFGRTGKPRSHRLAIAKDIDKAKSVKFALPNCLKDHPKISGGEHGLCVAELRGTGGYTVFPPSTHPSGENIGWHDDLREKPLPAREYGFLKSIQGLVAFLAVCVRFYPGKGSRDDFCMALTGALLRAPILAPAGKTPAEIAEAVDKCVKLVAKLARDDEWDRRGKAERSLAKLNDGENVCGLPRAIELLGLRECEREFRKWLDVMAPNQKQNDSRVQIQFDDGDIGDHLDQLTAVLAKATLPIYQIGGRLVEPIRLDKEETEDGVIRPAGALILNRIERYRLGDLMSQVVYLFKIAGRSIRGISPCAAHIADHYLKRAGHWPHPVLNGIVEAPTLRTDGTVATKEGYDPASGLYLDFRGMVFPQILDEPSRDNALAALAVLKAPLEEFPFVDDAARSVALSAVLTAFCRRALIAAPLHAFDAPVRGTGKTLLANIAPMIFTGRKAIPVSQGATEEEDEKRLLSILMRSDAVVLIDNINRPLQGDALCTILTEASWQCRRLGHSEEVHVRTNTLFMATGNNLQFSGDMGRRGLICQLDAEMEKPEERPFKRDLNEYLLEHRGELAAAALTVLRAFVVAGRPGAKELTPYGSYEQWSALVRSALVWLGEPDPCETRELIEAVNPAKGRLLGILVAMAGDGRKSASEMVNSANEGNSKLRDALAEALPRGIINARALGVYLSKHKGTIAGGYRLDAEKDTHDEV